MIINEKNILSDDSLGGQASDKTNSHKVDLMNIANSKSTLVNNSFSSNTERKNEDKICNALGCNVLASNEISMKIGEKSITIFICERCKPKFE